jgi:ADP-ribose pyrophosphatase YjhB (NUDIX family)
MTGQPDQPAPGGRPGDAAPLSESEFQEVFAKVPRLTVEVMVQGPAGVLLTKRTSGPCAGLWHVPGGTVRFGEPLTDAVRRVASTETGLRIQVGQLLGYIEYPSHYLNGLDSPVGIAFLCHVDGEQQTNETTEHGWFTVAPEPMHPEQIDFLVSHGLLSPRGPD